MVSSLSLKVCNQRPDDSMMGFLKEDRCGVDPKGSFPSEMLRPVTLSEGKRYRVERRGVKGKSLDTVILYHSTYLSLSLGLTGWKNSEPLSGNSSIPAGLLPCRVGLLVLCRAFQGRLYT